MNMNMTHVSTLRMCMCMCMCMYIIVLSRVVLPSSSTWWRAWPTLGLLGLLGLLGSPMAWREGDCGAQNDDAMACVAWRALDRWVEVKRVTFVSGRAIAGEARYSSL